MNKKFNGKTPKPPGIPDWLLAAFDVVITLGEIDQKATGELIGQKATGKGTAR